MVSYVMGEGCGRAAVLRRRVLHPTAEVARIGVVRPIAGRRGRGCVVVGRLDSELGEGREMGGLGLGDFRRIDDAAVVADGRRRVVASRPVVRLGQAACRAQ